MEFPFRVDKLFGPGSLHGYNSINIKSLFTANSIQLQQFCTIIDTMGQLSSTAQNLPNPITISSKLLHSTDRLYIATEGLNTVTAILRIGEKSLFIRSLTGSITEINPCTSVLDFYVHESRQRIGIGIKLFELMLYSEGYNSTTLPAYQLSYDRPSKKLLKFLDKYFQLNSYIPQNNNFVVFNQYFQSPLLMPESALQSRSKSGKGSSNNTMNKSNIIYEKNIFKESMTNIKSGLTERIGSNSSRESNQSLVLQSRPQSQSQSIYQSQSQSQAPSKSQSQLEYDSSDGPLAPRTHHSTTIKPLALNHIQGPDTLSELQRSTVPAGPAVSQYQSRSNQSGFPYRSAAEEEDAREMNEYDDVDLIEDETYRAQDEQQSHTDLYQQSSQSKQKSEYQPPLQRQSDRDREAAPIDRYNDSRGSAAATYPDRAPSNPSYSRQPSNPNNYSQPQYNNPTAQSQSQPQPQYQSQSQSQQVQSYPRDSYEFARQQASYENAFKSAATNSNRVAAAAGAQIIGSSPSKQTFYDTRPYNTDITNTATPAASSSIYGSKLLQQSNNNRNNNNQRHNRSIDDDINPVYNIPTPPVPSVHTQPNTDSSTASKYYSANTYSAYSGRRAAANNQPLISPFYTDESNKFPQRPAVINTNLADIAHRGEAELQQIQSKVRVLESELAARELALKDQQLMNQPSARKEYANYNDNQRFSRASVRRRINEEMKSSAANAAAVTVVDSNRSNDIISAAGSVSNAGSGPNSLYSNRYSNSQHHSQNLSYNMPTQFVRSSAAYGAGTGTDSNTAAPAAGVRAGSSLSAGSVSHSSSGLRRY